MKKIAIILSGITIGSMMITSCQQKASDAEVEAKVTEMYNEEKTRVENDLSAACDSAVSATVAAIKDSLSHLNAKQQAALLEQTRKQLAAAKKKAAAASANKNKSTTTTTTTPAKPVNTVDSKLDDRFGGKAKEEVAKEVDKKLDDRFGDKAKENQVKEVDKKLDDRFGN